VTTHHLHITPRVVFVALASLAWIGLVLWLTVPWLDGIGDSATVAVAVALIVGVGIVPAISELQLIALRVFGDQVEEPPER
jgi:hypothetical protein